MKPTVLLLSTYPYVKPLHGGQIRLAHIAKAYHSAGWQVKSIAVYDVRGYRKHETGPGDIAFPFESAWRQFQGRAIPFIDDLLSGLYAESTMGGFPLVMKKLPRRIDAIHVEQPWLWSLACKIKAARGQTNLPLIFGSQNIESSLKREILSDYGIPDMEEVVSVIETLEQRAAQEAQLSTAVTQADLDILASYGAGRLLLAPNGIEPWHATEQKIEEWRTKLPESPWLLYVASAHPPNFSGFTRIVGDSLGFIPPDSRLVVAGTVSEHLYRVLAETRWHALNLSRLQLLFTISDSDLAAVKELAHVFIIPISHGGGSNIKTAEAIYSGAYVVGSKLAFRGYEDFLCLSEITTAETPLEFRNAISTTLQQPRPDARIDKNELRRSLRWDERLASIPEKVELIMRENHGR